MYIHCLNELQQLIQKCKIRPNDCLVYVGDVLDKGPQGPQTVRWIYEKSQIYKTVVVMGNHELKNLLRFQSFTEKLSKDPTVKLPSNVYTNNYFALRELDKKFLTQSLLYFKVPKTQFIVIHAGVTPKCTLPKSSKITNIRRLDQTLLRVRFVRVDDEVELTTKTKTVLSGAHSKIKETISQTKILKKYEMISLGEEWEKHQYWAQIYDGRFGHILFGHSSWKEDSSPKLFPHTSGLDLGCVYGGKLCAAIVTPNAIDQNNADISYVTVDALKTYTLKYKATLIDDKGYYREQ